VGKERNINCLPTTGISPRITHIMVKNSTKMVHVQMTADVSPLFPESLQARPISAWGEAQVRVSGADNTKGATGELATHFSRATTTESNPVRKLPTDADLPPITGARSVGSGRG
jgi:hypothetical protein